MNSFGSFLLFCIIFYFILSWLIPQILSWIFKRKFHLNVTIGRIVFPYLKLKDVYISRSGFKVHIDEIGFRSSFFSSEVTKLIALVVHDVRINKDVGARENKKNSNVTSNDQIPDFRYCTIPPMIITFAQFMAIHVYNVNTMLFGPETPEFLVHATAGEVHLDGSIVHNSRTLLVNITVAAASAKLLRHAIGDSNTQTCLAELSFGISLEAILKAQGPLSVEKLILGMNHTIAVINEGFYGFAQERNQGKEITYSKYKRDISFKELFFKINPINPKELDIKIEDTYLTGTKNSHTDFNSTLKCFKFNSKFGFSNDIDYNNRANLNLQLDYFDVRCNKEIAILLKIFTINGELEKNDFNFNILLKTLAVNYNHKDIFNWIETHFKRPQNEIKTQLDHKFNREIINHSSFYSWVFDLFNRCILKISADLWNVSALVRLSDEPLGASAGFNHMKITLNLFEKVDTNIEYGTWFINFFQQRQYGAECLIESLWCRLGNSSLAADSHLLKRFHAWGTPLFIGIFLVEIKNNKHNKVRLFAMLDTLHLEWSPALAKCIARGHKCISEYTNSLGQQTSKIKESTSTGLKLNHFYSNCIFNFKLTNSNCFMIVDKNLCLMIRLDSAILDSNSEDLSLNVSGAKMISLAQDSSEYSCLKAEEIKNACGHIHQARCTYKYKTRESLIRLIDEIQFSWSTQLHLTILALLDQFHDFNSALNVHSKKVPNLQSKENRDCQQLYILLKGRLELEIKISTNHTLSVSLEDLSCEATADQLSSMASNQCQIALDSHTMFTFTRLKVSHILEDKEVHLERDNSEGFQLPWNNTWEINIEAFKAIFPYEHHFAEAVQNRFIALFKWLKLIHKRHQNAKLKHHSLPSDLVIVVKEFVFEMSDDPFEVRLRDNYELLEDEYKESLKRQQLLDAKVHEYSMKHLLPPAGKVDELYANLKKKNGEIYVQRSKQIQKAGPPRTRLFAWLMNDIKIMSLADPSIHGAENVISVMTEIDPETPWPEEGLEFTTLWCRSVSARCREWKFQLRDFPQPWLDIENLHIWGRLVGAEQEATRRAKRAVKIEIGPPWNDDIIERSMTSLKLYHDFNCDIDRYSYAFGPCWEPVIAQCMLSFEKISSPSRDPSPPLPFWDKMRLLFHGRLTMCVSQMTVLLHASLDPYNTTEEMELTWTNLAFDWTNAKVVLKGDLDVYVRTASKYDDCRLLHLPNLRLTVKLDWACLGNPNDHHSVMPCAPDKLPEYSSNQEHDSFRAFRSQNLNVSISLETKPTLAPGSPKELDCPLALLYGSTLRWFENLKLILSGVTRPTKRGAVFNNLRPRKTQLSRHYKKVHLLVGFHRFQVLYWMSFAMQRGFELFGGRISSSSEHILNLIPTEDGLKHRPRSEWFIVYMNCELNDTEIWLKSALQQETGKDQVSLRQPVEKCYCLSVGKVSYGRETILPKRGELLSSETRNTPVHRLVVYDLKGAWTKSNRDVAFALFDTFVKTKQLKKNLSNESLKGFRGESNSTPMKSRNRPSEGPVTPPTSIQGSLVNSTNNSTETESDTSAPSPLTKLQSGHAATMLQQLIAEADNKAVVFSDDLSVQTREQHLQGLAACQEDDVLHKNWLIVLINSQVLLKGCETKGYVILSAAKAEILQRVHRPVWKERTLVSKTTWVGSLECMQYYATVSAGETDSLDENIMWLTVENIQEKDSTVIADVPDLPHLVGSGQSVGGVVSETVGASSLGDNPTVQLQRIVSRCKCEFFYAGYGESSIDPGTLAEVPPPPNDEAGIWEKPERAVDAFTLMHHDLDVCTNSLQYAMILDIVNNLLLYVEPRRKEASERLQRMRFQLQLYSIEDQRRPIQQLQNQVRSLLSKLRRLEKETYLLQRILLDEPGNEEYLRKMDDLEFRVYECKEHLNSQSEELDMMLSCYKESQLSANQRMATLRGDKPLTTVRANEICFKHAQWRLTEADGQLGIADLVLSNFLYTKKSKSDDSGEHLLELGYVRMTNLLPNQIYKEVLSPTEIQSNMPVDRKKAVRVFCREKAPVGGISVKEHFEINVVPFTIGLTKKFYNTMLKFCFPERDPDTIDGDPTEDLDGDSANKGKKVKTNRKGKETNFYVPIEHKDDVEKMKERAEKNKLFIYIKIPEVPVRVSYKGNKEKNLEDIRDFSLVIPTLEYHNVTWTWLDLLMAMKTDTRRVIFSQAIKQKLQIKMTRTSAEEGASPQEEDKARMLFGSRHVPGDSRSLKKGMFKFQK